MNQICAPNPTSRAATNAGNAQAIPYFAQATTKPSATITAAT